MNTKRIEQIRKSRGFTQDKLVEKVGFSKATYHNLLKNGEFRISQLEIIAKVLKVPLSYFLDDEKKSNYQVANGDHNNLVNESIVQYETKNKDLQKEIKELKKEIKYLKEINELLKSN